MNIDGGTKARFVARLLAPAQDPAAPPALESGAASLSYRELADAVAARAGQLRCAGAAGAVVALERPRSAGFVVDYLAVLAEGGTVVPLDPDLPPERREIFLRAARPTHLVDGGEHVVALEEGPRWTDIPPDGGFVYFTSGSTGLPKPVLGSVAALDGFTRWFCPEFAVTGRDRFAFTAGVSFEASLRDIFPPLAGGATLVVPGPDDLRDPVDAPGWLTAAGITVLTTVPSVARAWLRAARAPCPTVRAVFYVGEPPAVDVLTDWTRAFPTTAVQVNSYGSTEGGQATVFHRVETGGSPPGEDGPIPAGRPVPGTAFTFVDPRCALTADRVRAAQRDGADTGEVVLVSRATSHGYLGAPAATAEKFVAMGDGATACRTGDLGRVGPDGELFVIGRADDQIKINGVRVHPAEVTRALRDQPGVADVHVIAATGPAALTAYVVPTDGPLDVPDLRRALTRRLPLAMIPGRFVEVPALPRARTGKVDRAGLVALAADGSDQAGAPLAAGTATWVATAVAELLGVGRPGPEADLFALGADSLVAAALSGRIARDHGVAVTPRTLFGAATVAGIAAAVDTAVETAADPAVGPAGTGIPVLDRTTGRLPMSAAQRGLYLATLLHPDSPAYNTVEALRLRGPVDRPALHAALAAVLARHEVLRTVVRLDDDGPSSLLAAPDLVAAQRVAVVPAGADLDATLRGLAAVPFDLGAQLPLRVTLVEIDGDDGNGDDHALVLVAHHIASDAWSCRLLVAEFLRAYAGERAAPLPRAYADVAVAQDAEVPASTHAQYWRDRLGDAPPVLDLPRDAPRPLHPTDRGAEVDCAVPAGMRARLHAAARAAGVTPFALLLTAYGYVLGRYTGTDDVVVGVPVSGRVRAEAEELVGCFVNTVALRLDLRPAQDRRDLVGRVFEAAGRDLDHAALPFEQVVAAVAPERVPGVGQVVQVLLNYYPATPATTVAGLEVAPLPVARERAKFDLTATVVDDGDAVRILLDHALDVVDGGLAARVGEHLVAVLDALLDDLDAPVSTLPAGPPAELGHRGEVVAVAAEPVLARFARAAAAAPDRVAVRTPTAAITYRELDRRATAVARFLATRPDAGPDAGPVGLLLTRSVDHVVGMLGAVKAGVAYLPLDPTMPVGYLTDVVRAAGTRLVLTHPDAGPTADLDGPEVVALATAEASGASGPPPIPGEPEDLAYVLFTSGSTGTPKGVMVENRHLAAYVGGMLGRMRLPDGLHYALLSPFAADLGLLNVFGALCTGGTLHVLPYDHATDPVALGDYLRAHPVDVVKLVPSHLAVLLDAGAPADLLPHRDLVLAGEACPWDLVDAARAARPGLRVWNHYGPTETTVSVLAHAVPEPPPAERGSSVPLGVPFDHVRVQVVDADRRPVPRGAPGELLIGGASVARGYLQEDPEHTPFVTDSRGERAYRSGDRVRWRGDASLEFLGRLDRQAKIRGYRVEPGYVEAVLRSHPDVVEAAVTIRDDIGGGPALVAYPVTADAGAGSDAGPEPAELAEYLRERLPPYLVPTAIVPTDDLPLTAAGKLDVAALPAPEPLVDEQATPPRHDRDERMAAIWCAVLGRDTIGIDDDFFAVGGDSLTAIRLARRIGDGIRVLHLFQHPTVRRLVDFRAADSGTSDALLHRLPGPAGTDPAATLPAVTIVAVPFGGGTASAYRDLARTLPPDVALHALELPGHDPTAPEEDLLSYAAVTARAAAEIRATITGPVVVYGHCVGAALAYSLAQELTAEPRTAGAGPQVVGMVAGGAFPAPRLPGRLAALWARVAPRDRWRGDRLYRDMLRSAGGLGGGDHGDHGDDHAHGHRGADPDEPPPVRIAAVRHDARESEDVYSRACHGPEGQRRVPVLAVVGEHDRDTEFPHERYREWNMLGSATELAVIPDAGHYFLTHQADQLAETVTAWARERVSAPAPPVAAEQPRRRGLAAFALISLGQLVSMTGSRALAFALGLWVFLRTGSVTEFSGILVTAVLPGLLALPFAGAAADRWNRRLLMVAGELVSAVGSVLVLVAFATGSLQLWHVYVAASLASIATAVQQPAYLASVAQLVPKQYLGRTNGALQAVLAVSQAGGPLVGGALFVLVGLGGAIWIDLATIVVALVTLAAVRIPDLAFRRRAESVSQEIRGGVAYIARRRPLVDMVVFFLAFNLTLGFALALIPPMVLSIASGATLTAVTVVGALGGVAGGLAMALWGGTERRATGMIGFVALTGAGLVAAGLTPVPAVVLLGMAGVMASIALINGHWQTMIQVKVGAELQGRVLTTNRMIANLTEPVGYLGAGWLADAVVRPAIARGGPFADTVAAVVGTGPGRGLAILVVALGVAQLLLAGIGLRWRALHHMEDALPDAVPGPTLTWDRDELQRAADSRLA